MGESISHAIEPDDSQQETSSGNKRKIEAGSSQFDILPLEMIHEVFKKMPLEEVIRLGNETALLNSAARTHAKWALMGLRRSVSETLGFLSATLKDLPMSKDHWRTEIVKSFYLTRYISTEVELLFASVWRFRDDEAAWNILAPHLGPVVSEFERKISAQLAIETRKPNLTLYRTARMLGEWYRLTEKLENGLYDTLDSAATRKTPFEIRVIDMLMCAPSYSFQLALKRITGKQQYSVYGFFKSPNFKPVGELPNVFDSQLNVDQKKCWLMSYLRETVQQESLYFLADLFNSIYELEMAQLSYLGDTNDNNRMRIMDRLSEEYQKVHETPYSPVLSKSRYRIPKDLYEEYYIRCSHENLSITGLHCTVVAPSQDICNIPLVIPFLRGRRQKLYDHFECEAMDGTADLPHPPFVECPSYTALTSSDVKPKLQLVIHFRESYLAGPSEVAVNIGYDNDDRCYITFHNFHGEPLIPTQQPSPPIPTPQN